MHREYIKDKTFRVIGCIETDNNGNKIGKDYVFRVVGRYDARQNITKDFYGKVIGTGDQLSSLIRAAYENKQN